MVRKPSDITAVDLFAGAGGLSLGFSSAGFRVIHAVEAEQNAARTYARNHPSTRLSSVDIRTLGPSEVMGAHRLQRGQLTAVIAGLPCQGFSESNRRTRSLSNPRNHLFKELLRFAEVLNPTWIVIENVAGLETLAGGKLLARIKRGMVALGYAVDSRILISADYGVPQIRRRLFIIGTTCGSGVPFPAATHGERGLSQVTVREAISDLPVLRNGAAKDRLEYRVRQRKDLTAYQRLMREGMGGKPRVQGNLVSKNNAAVVERYAYIPPGGNWEDVPTRLMRNYEDTSRCHTGIYHRLEWDQASKVIGNFRKNMLIHPSQNRGLSVREAARLQSFPDHYEFVGSIGFQQQQVADAVPPLLAQAVAKAILCA